MTNLAERKNKMRTIRIQCDFCFKIIHEDVEQDCFEMVTLNKFGKKTICIECLDIGEKLLKVFLKEIENKV